MEPYTTSWFASQFAAGIVGHIGGQTLGSLMSAAGIQPDMKKLIDMAVAELKSYIDSRLDQQTLVEVQGRLDGCYELLSQFENNPSERDRLSRADQEAQIAISTLRQFAINAVTPYIYAVSLKFYCITAIRNSDEDRGELANYKRVYDDALAHLYPLVPDTSQALHARIAGVSNVKASEIAVPVGENQYRYMGSAFFMDNGRKVEFGGDTKKSAQQKADKSRNATIAEHQRKSQGFDKDVLLAANEAKTGWEKGLVAIQASK